MNKSGTDMTKESTKIRRQCSVCGRKIFGDGYYFGKIPLYTDQEFDKARNAGTSKERWGKTVVEILKKDPTPYAHAEYWECQRCY